jgi:hypothetical protein
LFDAGNGADNAYIPGRPLGRRKKFGRCRTVVVGKKRIRRGRVWKGRIGPVGGDNIR